MIEEPIFDKVEKWYTHGGHGTFSKKEPYDGALFLDGGGSQMIGEPVVKFEANGVKFETFLRHAPFMLEFLKKSVSNEGWIKFGSFPIFVHCLSGNTRDAAVEKLEEVCKEREEEARKLEDDLIHKLTDSGVKYMGKCGCQSGHPYKICCGRRN
jgi:hypothetical protein